MLGASSFMHLSTSVKIGYNTEQTQKLFENNPLGCLSSILYELKGFAKADLHINQLHHHN